jgi:hypothetical protein
VLVVRAPWVLVWGRFWAEEATVYLAYAWSHSFLEALTAPHLGYYNLVANMASILATHVPLESAPRCATALALLIQVIPAAVILFASIPGLGTPLRKGGALLLLLVVPANPEIYLNSINSHFLLCAATGVVLVSEHRGRADRLGKWLLLGLVGLTGVVSTFLAPLFWVQWWLERRRERLVQAAILSACALLQLGFVSRALEQDERHLRFNSTAIVGAAYAKFIAMPLVSTERLNQHMAQLRATVEATGSLPAWVWIVTAGGFAGFLLVCWRSGRRSAMLLAAAAIWVSLLSFSGSREAATDQKLLGHLTYAFRYYYAPQFFFLLALLAALAPDTSLPFVLRGPTAVWLAGAMLMGSVNFARGPIDWPLIFSGPPWGPQVEQWRRDPSRPLAVWPAGWQFNLPPRP